MKKLRFRAPDRSTRMKATLEADPRSPRSGTLRRIADNALSLFALQGFTYLVSFLTVPFLLRTLGDSKFGSVAFANTIMAQFILLTDFGFASSATRLVAIRTREGKPLGTLFGAVTTVKMLLLLLSATMVAVLALFVPRFQADRSVLAMAFLQVVGSVLFPAWLFQGLERMRAITIISIVARLISSGLLFLLVHGPHDTVLSMACQSGGVLLQGLMAVYYALFVLGIKPAKPSLSEIRYQIRDSFHPFLGASMGNLVGGSSVLFLGMFKDMATVGNYAAIERTARAEVMAMLPASQAAYPHVTQRFHESLRAGNRVFLRLCAYLLGSAFVFVSLIAVFARPILHLLYGDRLLAGAHLLSAFSIWSFLSLLNTLLGLHYLIASGHAKAYGRSVFWSALSTAILFLTLIPHLSAWGSLLAVLVGELVQTVLMAIFIVRINLAAAAKEGRIQPVKEPVQ